MKLIKWIKDGWKRRQHRQWDAQYHDGVQWAYNTYYTEGYSLEHIGHCLATYGIATAPFDRGAHAALLQIQRTLAAKRQELNQKGEPIDTPFFIGTSQQKADCEKRVAEEMYFIEPHLEALRSMSRRQYTVKLRMVSGTDNTE